MSRVRLTLLAAGTSLSLLVGTIPGFAASLEAASKIAAVTVYPDAASVTRTAEIDVPAGATSIVFKGLPLNLDPASLRVEGSAEGDLSIGSVEARTAPSEVKPGDSGVEARLKQLRFEREGWQATVDALEGKKAMIARFGEASPEKLSPDSGPLDIGRWQSAWDLVGQGLAKVGDELRAARGSLRDVDDQIRTLESVRQRPAQRQGAGRDVVVELEAGAAMKGRLTLTYRVSNASWRPVYDARLETAGTGGKPSLELVRRAAVTQRTGEDWAGVTLTLSTVRAVRGTSAPDLSSLQLQFYEPPVAYARQAAKSLAVGAQDAQRRESMAPAAAPPAPERVAEERESTVEAGAYQAAFRVPGAIDVPADGATKMFRVGSRKLVPELSVRTTPVVDETAFLSARFTLDEEVPLLPGLVSIHRDGTYVGQGRLALVAPGESAELGFGADDRVKVSRVPVRRKENEPSWIGSTKTETREFRTTMKNLHDFPIKIAIFDRLPISENSAISIDMQPATTPPTDKIVEDRRGVMAWRYDLAPSESRDVRFAYRMKWPADREVDFVETPLRKN